MADMKLNKNTFTILIGAMAAIVAVLAVILVVNLILPGFFAGIINGDSGEETPVVEETGPWGEKYFEWTYLETNYQTEITITKDAYKASNTAVGGYDLQQYIAEDIDGTIWNLASELDYLAKQNGLYGKDIVNFVIAFVQSIQYDTDAVTGHPSSYPRTPIVTLADETGDSTDLSILAAALIDSMGYSVALVDYPSIYHSGISVPSASAIAIPTEYSATSPEYTISNGKTSRLLEVIWVADTESLGFPSAAYFIEEPEIIPASGFWSGKVFEKAKAELPTETIYQIPDQDINLDVSWNSWKWNTSIFYEKKWYDTGISWKSNDKWILYEHLLTVTPTPYAEPSKDGILPGSLWRLSYTVTPTITLETDDGRYAGLTPFASVDIAVYDISSGEPVLIDTIGWEGLASANTPQTSPVYPPGEYAVGLFSRNAEVEITVQCSENLYEVTYTGGI